MSYLTALTKDSLGQRNFKLQNDCDDLKFDEEMKKKSVMKIQRDVKHISQPNPRREKYFQLDDIFKILGETEIVLKLS